MAFAIYFMVGRFSPSWSAASLAIASVGFYSWWDANNLLPLSLSITVNYAAGITLVHWGRLAQPLRRLILLSGIGFNLGMLGWYKYSNFFASIATQLGSNLPHSDVLLPLGVSFFTFTQIAFLVDAYRGDAKEYNPVTYVLFVTFFPHLIAGPIIHHKQIMPQFANRANYRLIPTNVAIGLTIATIGLCKKIFLADNLAPFADGIFSAEGSLTLLEAWMGASAYTFQLYFDFSGYSEMAVGFALMFNIRLPWNFASPYKATSIIDFWRRWHMTLSQFLRDYLYFPLGGNRKGKVRTYLNVFLVMLLGGLWHGAGWTFIAWGALHGIFLLANHAWRDLRGDRHTGPLGRMAGWLVTFTCVTVAWVFFRAQDINTALEIVKGMAGFNGIALGENHRLLLGGGVDLARSLGIRFVEVTEFSLISLPWLAAAAAICFLLPSTREWVEGKAVFPVVFRLRFVWGVAFGLAALCALGSLGGPSQFLYFNF